MEMTEPFCAIPLVAAVTEENLGLLLRIYSLRLQGFEGEEMEDLCDPEQYPVDLYDEVTNLYLTFQAKEMQEE